MTEHLLILKFGRMLSQDEWRTVIEAARELPIVQSLEARELAHHENCRWSEGMHQMMCDSACPLVIGLAARTP